MCQAALQALAPDDLQARLAVGQTLERAGGSPSVADLEPLLVRMEHDWSGYAASVPPLEAWDAVTQAVSRLTEADPPRGLRLLELHLTLPSRLGSRSPA